MIVLVIIILRKGKKKTEDHMSWRSVFCCLSNNYMISFKSSKCNIISQSQYDSEIRRICSCISSFPCPFCESCSLVFYGRYPRRICVPDIPEFIIIRVQRVFCTHCGRTHALLPDLWMPRSPIPVSLVPVIASLAHHQFSAFQNTFYPLTDKFLYSLIKRYRKISQDAHPLLRIFSLYQHNRDTFSFMDAF